MEDSNNKRFNKRHHYTMKEKLEIINYYHAVDEKGNKLHKKSEVLKNIIDHKSLEYWEKNEIKIKDSDNLNKKTLHRGRPNTFTEEEEEKKYCLLLKHLYQKKFLYHILMPLK